MHSQRAIIEARQEAARENPTIHTDMTRHPEGGAINISSALTIVGVVIGAVVSLVVLAALAPTWFDATSDLVDNFTTADVGDATANSIANTVFPLVLGLLGVFALAGLAFAAMRLRK